MFLLYFILWVIFNGKVTLEICVIGLIVAAVMFAFTCKFMDYSIEKEKQSLLKFGKLMKYVGTLVSEIIKANYATVKMILSQREEIEPVLVEFESDVKTPVGKSMLANAITLTPGTITVSQEENKYVVHCLDESLAEGIDQSCFVDLVKEMEE